MKTRHLILVAFLSMFAGNMNAQKFAIVDTEFILNQMTEYKAAQKQLNELSQKWENDLKIMRDEIDKMYKDYRAEEILLNSTQKKEREDAIVAKEEEVKKFEQDKFGVNGELFKKRQELIAPIQDKISAAILRMAKKNGIDVVFDKSANMNILYNNAKYDRSTDVLEELGITQTEGTEDKDDN